MQHQNTAGRGAPQQKLHSLNWGRRTLVGVLWLSKDAARATSRDCKASILPVFVDNKVAPVTCYLSSQEIVFWEMFMHASVTLQYNTMRSCLSYQMSKQLCNVFVYNMSIQMTREDYTCTVLVIPYSCVAAPWFLHDSNWLCLKWYTRLTEWANLPREENNQSSLLRSFIECITMNLDWNW